MSKLIKNPKLALAALVLVSLSGCAVVEQFVPSQPTATLVPTVIIDPRLVAGGVVVPGESIRLAFLSSGKVEDVLVEAGDQVQVGEVLARLGNAESLLAEKQALAYQLLVARQALANLNKYADVDTLASLQRVLDARLGVVAAQTALDRFDEDQYLEDLEDAQDDRDQAQRDLEAAQADFEPYRDRAASDRTRIRMADRVRQAQEDLNEAIAALERLEVAYLNLGNALAAAQAGLRVAEKEYADRQSGPDVEQVETLQTQIASLEAQLAAIEAALENLVLTTPIAGTVVQADAKPGEIAAAGVPVFTIADFSTWKVETDDLTEIEVVRVTAGQSATLVLEALPNASLTGMVERIADLPVVRQGDVTYTVYLRLDPSELPLRWGMSVTVYFENENR